MDDAIGEGAVSPHAQSKIEACWKFWDDHCFEMQNMSIGDAAQYTVNNQNNLDLGSVKLDFCHYRTAQIDGSSVKALPYRSKSLFKTDGQTKKDAAIELFDSYFNSFYPTATVHSEPEQYRQAYAACYDLGHSSSACRTASEEVSKKAPKSRAKTSAPTRPSPAKQ